AEASPGCPAFARVVIQLARLFEPGRLEAKDSVLASRERYGWISPNAELTTGPTFTGADQGSPARERVAVQRSACREPVRFEKKKISSPSERIVARASVNGVLSSVIAVATPNEPSRPRTLM